MNFKELILPKKIKLPHNNYKHDTIFTDQSQLSPINDLKLLNFQLRVGGIDYAKAEKLLTNNNLSHKYNFIG